MSAVPYQRPYQRLSIAEKQALHRDRMREPAVVCPVCETQTTPADLPEHTRTRCPGQREPAAGSKWVTWREALALGVPRETFAGWIRRGRVRFRGERQDRQYLLRDLAQLAARRGASPMSRTADAAGGSSEEKKSLTHAAPRDPEGHVNSKPKNDDAYTLVQAELDTALAAEDPAIAAAACRRAQLALARAAAGPDFDMRRHRAIAGALKELARVGRPGKAAKPETVGAQ